MTRIALWLAQHQLKSKKPAHRLWALRTLRTALNDAVVALDDKLTIALLDHTLADPETEIRREVAGILSDLRDVRALPSLIRALSDPNEAVQKTAIQGLKKLDDRAAIAALAPKLINGTDDIRWSAALALKSLGWRPKTDAEQIRFFIALGEIKRLASFGAEAVKPLIELLRQGTNDKKIAAVNVLGEIGDPAALKPLQNLLRDPDPLVRSAAVYALERAGYREAAPSLIPILKDAARNVRLAAALALGSLGDASAVEPLIKLLNDTDWEIRRAALESLGKRGDPRAFPSVAKHLDDTDQEVREVAANTVGTIGNESIVEKLVFTMVDAHSGVRQAAARALTRIYPQWERSDRVKKLLPEIQAAMKHRDVSVQFAATNLFQRLAGADLSQPALAAAPPRPLPAAIILRELLQAADPEFRQVAVESIGRMRLKECEADLKKALEDADSTVKDSAQAALSRLAAGETSTGGNKVTFLAKAAEVPAPEIIPAAAEEVLICSAMGEVLHEWKCRDLAGWLKTIEFISPQAEQLARLMTLGEIKRVTIPTEDAGIVIITSPDGSVMFRSKKISAVPATTGTEPRETGVSESAKEFFAEWLRRTPSGRGVLMRGIRFPDQTFLCDVDSRDLPAAAIEEAYRLAYDTHHWLKNHRLATSQITWSGNRAELHCTQRADRSVLGIMTSAKTGEVEPVGLNRQLVEFQNLRCA